MSKTKVQVLAEVHNQALKEFDSAYSAQKDERAQSLEDRRFYSIDGAQWEGDLEKQFESKPRFQVNKIHLAVIRIFNEYRNNRIDVEFVAKDGAKNVRLADVCNGLYRADEQDSCAEEAYDNAFEESVGGGIGAWRLRACYEDDNDDENEHQRIKFEPIYDADSCVFFDSGSKRQDKSDATRCFVLTSMTKDQYRDEYDDEPDTWDKSITNSNFDWNSDDCVYVAEYYKKEVKKEVVYTYRTLNGEEQQYRDSDFDENEDLESELLAVGSVKIREKKIRRTKIHKYILSGGGVLEDCGYIAGSNIPVVITYGKRWIVDNIERAMGHVRLSKDAQRLKNMQLSKLAEISAASSVEKPIFTPDQISGHETMWAEDNIKNYPYLLANPLMGIDGELATVGPAAYTRPPQIPPAMAALLQITEQDIKDLLGNQEAGDQIAPNISGKVVELIQNRLDMQSFIYISNFSKAIRRSGQIWLSMARDILVEPNRKLKIVGAQGEVDSVELGKPILDKDGAVTMETDLSKANFDVNVEVGPSSSSKRQATVRSLMAMLRITTDEETRQVISSMIMMNMEGEGVEDVRGYFRKKLIKMGVVEPTKQEASDLLEASKSQQPDPNTVYLQSAAEAERARAEKAQADTLLAVARTEEIRANTAQILAGIDREDQQAALEIAKAISNSTGTGE